MFCKYNWPGNVRELSNIMESIYIMVQRERTLDIKHLPKFYYDQFRKIKSINPIEENRKDTLSDILYNVEKSMIVNALTKFKENKSLAAKSLGISAQNINYKIKKFDIS